jgi:endonuclease G, mitochondrial
MPKWPLLFAVALLGASAAWAQGDPYGLDLGSPCESGCAMVYHTGFALCYSEPHEQARWVAYELTRAEVESEKASRKTMQFAADPEVATGSATKDDYRNSGYDKGHLAPAADMKWNAKAMRECFLLSNISPQRHDFNAGVWEELESAVREAAVRLDTVAIVTGPVLEKDLPTIGPDQVSVPRRFFKVLLHHHGNDVRAIGFLIPNEFTVEPFTAFAVSVDAVETATGLDFFNALDDSMETAAECATDVRWWFPASASHAKAARKRFRP